MMASQQLWHWEFALVENKGTKRGGCERSDMHPFEFVAETTLSLAVQSRDEGHLQTPKHASLGAFNASVQETMPE